MSGTPKEDPTGQGNFFERMRSIGDFKREQLRGVPSDNFLAKEAGVVRETVGKWLAGARFPQDIDPVLAVVNQVRAEAARVELLNRPAVAELLDERRVRAAYDSEADRRAQSVSEAVERQRALAILAAEEHRARLAALPDPPRPLKSWTARRLGVHPAVGGHPLHTVGDNFVLPAYVDRPHDFQLRQYLGRAAGATRSVMVLVRGESCTGKTRTAYEAVRSVVADWDLLFPIGADSLLAALAADAIGARTVLWLNEIQDYLSGPEGEAAAAALLRRLDQDGPLIVMATLWPDYDRELTSAGSGSGSAPHPHARALLAQAHRIDVPSSFADGLEAVREQARSDRSLAVAILAGVPTITQTLAAGPDLVDHFERPTGGNGVYGRALITAAMDLYRFGITSPIPHGFLQAAAPGYLSDDQRARAEPEWFTGALAYARTRVRMITSALQDVPYLTGMGAIPDVARLADYLEQHGRQCRKFYCPPASFWEAAVHHLPAGDLALLSQAAERRGRYRHAVTLARLAGDAGDPLAREGNAFWLASRNAADGVQEPGWSTPPPRNLPLPIGAPQIIEVAGNGVRGRLGYRFDSRQITTMYDQMLRYHRAGDPEYAEYAARKAARDGDFNALRELSALWAKEGNHEGAERLALAAEGHLELAAIHERVSFREGNGDHEAAERLAQRALDGGDAYPLYRLAKLRQEAGDLKRAEQLAVTAVDAGEVRALHILAQLRRVAQNHRSAKEFAQKAVDAGDSNSLPLLAALLPEHRRSQMIRYGLNPDGSVSEAW